MNAHTKTDQDGATAIPMPDHAAIRSHVELLHTLAKGAAVEGILAFTRIDANNKTRTERFMIGDVDHMTDAIVGWSNHPNLNLYSSYAIFRKDLSPGAAGGETDLRAVLALVGDLDSDIGKKAVSLDGLPVAPPYVVETSANNFHAVFPLGRALPTSEAKTIAEALGNAIGGDSGTKDISHLWRIPGTLNWPNAKKLGRGRPKTPQLVTVKSAWTGETVEPQTLWETVKGFAKTNSGSSSGSSSGSTGSSTETFDGLPADLKKLIAAPGYPEEDRSRTAGSVIFKLFRRGWSNDAIQALFEAYPNGIGERYAGGPTGKTDLRREIERLREKFGENNSGIQFDDFYAYMLEHKYIYAPLGAVWPAASVDSRLPAVGKLKASAWLDKNRPVEQMTWVPGEPVEIRDRLIVNGGWIEREGSRAFNLYRAPVLKPTTGNADRWVHHVERLYGEDAAHIVRWCAHRVQRPADKINHALVLGGKQGIGKDTLLEPVKYAIGAWNFNEVSPQQILGRFNGFLKSVVLRVSEARDLGEFDRFAFYDHMKAITAAPPDVLRIDEKNRQEYAIPNVCGVIITTNHKSDGIYLPADDRRHFVAWSDLDKSAFDAAYWDGLYKWYAEGGFDVVANYLQNLDLTGFNPKAPPPQTSAFFEIVNSSRTPEDAEFADALDVLAWPDAVTIAAIIDATTRSDFIDYLKDRRNSRRIPHRFEACGYTTVRNPHTEDGLWRPHGRRQVIYARSTLDLRRRVAVASAIEAGKSRQGWK